ncbi:hypothetical protein K1719_017009 [Acacia pycnantha]|nr:hypothetical protein K1719_017009 [Acacia pycnantha]
MNKYFWNPKSNPKHAGYNIYIPSLSLYLISQARFSFFSSLHCRYPSLNVPRVEKLIKLLRIFGCTEVHRFGRTCY